MKYTKLSFFAAILLAASVGCTDTKFAGDTATQSLSSKTSDSETLLPAGGTPSGAGAGNTIAPPTCENYHSVIPVSTFVADLLIHLGNVCESLNTTLNVQAQFPYTPGIQGVTDGFRLAVQQTGEMIVVYQSQPSFGAPGQ